MTSISQFLTAPSRKILIALSSPSSGYQIAEYVDPDASGLQIYIVLHTLVPIDASLSKRSPLLLHVFSFVASLLFRLHMHSMRMYALYIH